MEPKTFWEALPSGWVGPLAVVAVLAYGFDRGLKWVESKVEGGKKQTQDALLPKIEELEARVAKLETAHSAASKAIMRALTHASSVDGERGALIRGDLQAAFDALN